jgi:hypothetical protein
MDIALLSEVADLAEEANRAENEPGNNMRRNHSRSLIENTLGVVTWTEPVSPDTELDERIVTDDDFEDDKSAVGDDEVTSNVPMSNEGTKPRRSWTKIDSELSMIKDSLDNWVEPVSKLEARDSEATINDILKFRQALSHMDDSQPFGPSFGPASTRDNSIESAHQVYWKLLKLCTDVTKSNVVSFEVMRLLALDDNGKIIKAKYAALSRMFRPDRYDHVHLMAFLQTCDTLYKRLRFFRASVGNATVIDKHLEGMIDSLFYFVLTLLVLEMMDINPWPLLLSMSTILVSFSFSFGNSSSRYIDGVLLIAVRR